MAPTKVKSPINAKERATLEIRSGDTVRVWQKIQEKGKTRLQAFEGLVLSKKHGTESGATFTVRKVASGVGVEKIFPLYSPMIDKIEVIKRAKVRRAKLYYIREKAAKEIKRQMRGALTVGTSTESEMVRKDREAKEAEAEEARVAEEAAQQAEAEKAEEAPEVPAETPEEVPAEEK